MSNFEGPGEGWRLLGPEEISDNWEENFAHRIGDHVDVWVRQEPMLPLPVEPYTVIRVTWSINLAGPAIGSRLLILDETGYWQTCGVAYGWWAPNLPTAITGFEVLAKPLMQDEITWEAAAKRVRRETARAVLDAFEQANWNTSDVSINMIARDFGVDA